MVTRPDGAGVEKKSIPCMEANPETASFTSKTRRFYLNAKVPHRACFRGTVK